MNYRSIYHSDKEALVELFVGKSVVSVEMGGQWDPGKLVLSDGTKLEIVGNDGCGGCSAGHYWLTELNECENIITNVEVVFEDYNPDSNYYSDPEGTYHLFVYAGHQKINLASIEGSDGNGWYGTGFWIEVKK